MEKKLKEKKDSKCKGEKSRAGLEDLLESKKFNKASIFLGGD